MSFLHDLSLLWWAISTQPVTWIDNLIGWFGTVCILASYGVMHPLVRPRIKSFDWWFQGLTLIGCLGVSYITLRTQVWPSFTVNIVVLVGASLALWTLYRKKP